MPLEAAYKYVEYNGPTSPSSESIQGSLESAQKSFRRQRARILFFFHSDSSPLRITEKTEEGKIGEISSTSEVFSDSRLDLQRKVARIISFVSSHSNPDNDVDQLYQSITELITSRAVAIDKEPTVNKLSDAAIINAVHLEITLFESSNKETTIEAAPYQVPLSPEIININSMLEELKSKLRFPLDSIRNYNYSANLIKLNELVDSLTPISYMEQSQIKSISNRLRLMILSMGLFNDKVTKVESAKEAEELILRIQHYLVVCLQELYNKTDVFGDDAQLVQILCNFEANSEFVTAAAL